MANPSVKIIPILQEHMLSIAIWKSWSHHSKHKVHLYLLVWHFQTVWSFNNWTCIQAISRHLWQIWLLLLTTYRCTALWFMINNLIQKFKIKNPNTFTIPESSQKISHTEKSRAVDRSTIQFWNFLTKGHSTHCTVVESSSRPQFLIPS